MPHMMVGYNFPHAQLRDTPIGLKSNTGAHGHAVPDPAALGVTAQKYNDNAWADPARGPQVCSSNSTVTSA